MDCVQSPCDVKPFPKSEKFQDADVLIIGNTIVGDVLKDGFVLCEDNPLRKELFTLDEIDAIRKQTDSFCVYKTLGFIIFDDGTVLGALFFDILKNGMKSMQYGNSMGSKKLLLHI